jgi:hypothetical protein
LKRLLAEYPDCTYAAYAAYCLGQLYSRPGERAARAPDLPGEEIPADLSAALELVRSAQRHPGFPLNAEAQLVEAECLAGLHREAEASALLRRIDKLPGQEQERMKRALLDAPASPRERYRELMMQELQQAVEADKALQVEEH